MKRRTLGRLAAAVLATSLFAGLMPLAHAPRRRPTR